MRYFDLIRTGLSFSLLLAGAVACQRESNRVEQEQPANADQVTFVKETTGAPAGADSAASAPVAAGQAATAKPTWHQLQQRTQRRAPLVRRRALHRPIGVPDTAAPPPLNPRLTDLTLKASEFFRIDPGKPTEVEGADGTVVRIPAGALVDDRRRPVKGEAWLELKECYTLADLLLSDHVSATATGEPLRSSAMLLVRATANGRPLQLAKGAQLDIELPAARRRTGQQLYYGQARRQQPVQWMAAPRHAPSSEQIYTDARPMPTYGSAPDDLNRQVRYPAAAVENGTQGLVFVSFVVDEAGRVSSPKVLRGLGHGCDEEALRVLQASSGRWLPGRREGQAVKVKMTLPIRFARGETLLASADSTLRWMPAETAALPSPAPEPAAATALTSGQLGWLAVGRSWATSHQATLAVPAESFGHTMLRLVFPESKVIIDASRRGNEFVFEQVPRQGRAWLVGLRYVNDIPFLALREITLGQPLSEPLQFQETTLAELEKVLSRLK